MMLTFVAGIDRTEIFYVCIVVSSLIHYFTLVTVMWMGAEALLMFEKLIIVFAKVTPKYLVLISLICWCKSKKYIHRGIGTSLGIARPFLCP